MTHMTKRMLAGLAAGIVILTASACNTPTHNEEKQAAVKRWNAARMNIIHSLAQQQFETGDLEKATETCAQALAMAPDNPRLYELAGRIAMERGNMEVAFNNFSESVRLGPERPEPYYMLGVIFQRWQQYEPALRQYDKTYELAPDHIAGLLASAEMLVKLDRSDEAVNRLNEKLVYFEHNAAIRVLLGRIHVAERHFDQALPLLREASILAPDRLEILEHLAMAEVAAGQHGQAAEHLQQLLSIRDNRDRRDLRTALADSYMAMGQALKARPIYLELAQDPPVPVDLWIKLGQAAWLVGDTPNAHQAAAQVVTLAPDRFEGYLLQGMLARRAGRLTEAMLRFDQAAAKAPSNAVPHILKGMTLEQAGRVDEAATAYRAALANDPDDHRARRLLAGLDTSTGR